MAKNTLFNFLNSCADLNKIYADGNIKKLSTVTKEAEYFLCTLPHQNLTLGTNPPFTLNEHHISIYDKENNSLALSHYHYTAKLTDHQNRKYTAHIHFNPKDECNPTILINETTDGTLKKVVIDQATQQELIERAIEFTHPVLREIRKHQQTMISELCAIHAEHEKSADELSVNLAQNFDKHQSALGKIISTAKKLHLLCVNDHYHHEAMLVEQMQKQLANSRVAEKNRQQKPTTKNSSTAKKKASSPHKAPVKIRMFGHDNHQVDKALRETVDKLLARSKTLTDAIAPEALSALYVDVGLIYIELQNNPSVLSIDKLNKLNQAYSKIKQQGELQLRNHLKDKQFDQAEQLRNFNSCLNMKDVAQALQDNNAALLEFLITKADFNLQNQPVKVGKKTYNSALSYCYEQNRPDCLSICIKHNLSVLAPDKNGLPIAHSILVHKERPLYQALYNNQEKTLNNRRFYTQLATAIRNYLAEDQTHLTVDERASLEKAQEDYRLKAMSWETSSFYENLFGEHIKTNQHEILRGLPAEFVKMLESDKEICAVREQISSLTIELRTFLSKRELLSIHKSHQDHTDLMKKLYQDNDFTSKDMEPYRQQQLKELQDYATSLQKFIELHHLKGSIGSGAKERQANIARQHELTAQLTADQEQERIKDTTIRSAIASKGTTTTLREILYGSLKPTLFAAKREKAIEPKVTKSSTNSLT